MRGLSHACMHPCSETSLRAGPRRWNFDVFQLPRLPDTLCCCFTVSLVCSQVRRVTVTEGRLEASTYASLGCAITAMTGFLHATRTGRRRRVAR
ncbi:uncharacterized protein K460DRAFT_56433 [Cucurbitaria berberidis CBS 394.84]|uniref:Uncharacterized protein n=1 Tax=Cucurbitaria berberidis CBS 394.84 TaxID=1168544 RepID=A0A9P4LAF2_9PLEO|nr:uncharacterized protein K460DRAFT_56433 [Cucurbitaria berberidis CBS 394.84]KAF1847297.1 hypothetical protein K460DRAFT_56433 [Cucurbitaria berberidis CBS 394.84]